MSEPDISSFAAVDRSADPDFFLRYLERVTTWPPFVARARERMEAAAIGPGQTVVDVGCGIGSDAIDLAQRVGPSGVVHALDISDVVLARARSRAQSAGQAIDFGRADAASTGLADASTDTVWINRVLLFVENPSAVLDEVRRVLRPGGRLVAFENDGHSLFLGDDDEELAAALRERFARHFRNPRVAGRLARLAHRAGFREIETRVETVQFHGFEVARYALNLDKMLGELIDEGKMGRERAEALLRRMAEDSAHGALVVGFCAVTTMARR